MKTINSLFGVIFIVCGLWLILDVRGRPGLLRGIDLSIDPVGFGAIFFLLGVWIVMNDKEKGA
jgi:threonine/homoserine/homoserine lactone efflux protein